MTANDPGMQDEVAKDEDRALMSAVSPTLRVIDGAFGEGSAAVWLSRQLTVFNEFCGKREKMDGWQITSLAKYIVTDFNQLKASEIMLFLHQYASGTWGPLYGTVDPQEFLAVLCKKFLPWRARRVAQLEEDKARAERERDAHRPGILKPDEIKALRARLEKKWKEEEEQ